jgi:hypothetical protein
MKTCDKPRARAQEPLVRLSQSSGCVTTTPELNLRQKTMMVLVAVLSSFAVGSIPVVYAFTVAPTHNQTTTQTPIPRGEMF